MATSVQHGDTQVLGVFHDTGLDFNGAVLYRHEAPLWPPLFLRYYEDPREWCPSEHGVPAKGFQWR